VHSASQPGNVQTEPFPLTLPLRLHVHALQLISAISSAKLPVRNPWMWMKNGFPTRPLLIGGRLRHGRGSRTACRSPRHGSRTPQAAGRFKPAGAGRCPSWTAPANCIAWQSFLKQRPATSTLLRLPSLRRAVAVFPSSICTPRPLGTCGAPGGYIPFSWFMSLNIPLQVQGMSPPPPLSPSGCVWSPLATKAGREHFF